MNQQEHSTIASLTRASAEPTEEGLAAPPVPEPDDPGPSDEDDPKPFFAKSVRGLAAALEHCDISLRFDVRAMSPRWTVNGIERADDEKLQAFICQGILPDRCQFRLESKTGLRIVPYRLSRTDWDEFCKAICWTQQFDPFSQWLDALPRWDGIERIDNLLVRCLGAPDNAVTRFASGLPLIQACRYVTHPGFKCDEHVMLIGPPGILKSSIYQLTLPPDQRLSLYTDKLRADMTSKESGEALEGVVIAEFGELDMRRAVKSQFKMFLTSLSDGGFRPAYGRTRRERPRMAAMIATTDKEHPFSSDRALNRRWIGVRCKGRSNYLETRTFCDAFREQMWAEAKTRAALGDPFLPDALKPDQSFVSETGIGDTTTVADRIERMRGKLDGLSMDDIKWKLDLDDLRNDHELRAALDASGYRPLKHTSVSRDDGKRVIYRPWAHVDWVRPEHFRFALVRPRLGSRSTGFGGNSNNEPPAF